MRILTLLCLLSFVVVACDVDLASENDEPPTPVVITSTPANEAGTATASPESSDGSQPTATSDTAATASSTAVETSPTATTVDGEPTATSGEQDDGARAEIEAIEQDVVELRGLDLIEDIDEQIIDREELARRVEEILADEYSPEQAHIDALTYWLLRLIPDRSIDLYQLQIDLLSEQIAGYYNPETKELVVVTASGELTVTDQVTLAHEVVHALQDQHFDLIAIDELSTDADRGTAITALIEGDATLAMTEYMFGYLDPLQLAELLAESLTGGQDFGVLDEAPRYIADGLIFSYESGQAFATALYEDGGYAAIDAAFDDPPLSTEQIMHPEKYMSPERDDPMDVENPDISNDIDEEFELVYSDVLGEWDLQIMLEENGIGSGDASTAAEGWGGSWFDLYESSSQSLGLLTTRWDSDQDASEFADALMRSFQGDATQGAVWQEDERYFSVVAGGDTVVIISGTDENSVTDVLSLMSQTV